MAVLIERACTPTFSSKMNVDTDADGVVDGFTSVIDTGITATFALDDNAQKIAVTASTNIGSAYISTASFTVFPSTKYSFQVLSRGIVSAGAFKNNISIAWYDASDVFISNSDIGAQTPTSYWKLYRLENITSPANAAKARIYLRAFASVVGDTGTVWFRNVQMEKANTCSTFTDVTRADDAARMAIAPLSDTWSISFAVSPNFDYSNIASGFPDLVALYGTNVIVKVVFIANGAIEFTRVINGRYIFPYVSGIYYSRYQIIKILLSYAKNIIYMYARLNNGTTVSNTLITNESVSGLNNLSLSRSPVKSNSLIESITLYRNKAITTLAEADAIFDSMNAEMVVNGGFDNGSTGWTLVGGEVIENGMLKKVSTNASGIATAGSWQNIKVLPNNTYKIKARLIGYIDTNNKPILEIKAMDIFQSSTGIQFAYLYPTAYDQICETTITTSPNAYYISLHSISIGSGTFYWDDVSVQLIN